MRAHSRKLLDAAVVLSLVGFAHGANAQDQVNVRFSWKLKGEYAPMYLALESGAYAKENLSVRMGEGAGAQAALGGLIQGQEDIVIMPGVFAITAVQKGMPIKIVALYHPKAPIGILSFPDKPVNTPKDLEGKSIAHSIGETATTYLDVFCKINNVDCSKVKKVQMSSQLRFPQFLQKQVDLVSVYHNIEVPQLEKTSNAKYIMLDMAKYGFVIPGMAVVTSNDLIARKPDVLKRYLRATGRGVVEAKANPDAATKALLKNWSGGPDYDLVKLQIQLSMDAIPTPAGSPTGWTDEKIISDTLGILKSAGEIDQAKPLGDYYTNSLLSAGN